MLYQFQNSMRGDRIKAFFGTDVSYIPHLHNSFEFVSVTEGEMAITVDKKRYDLSAGDSLLIFPNQIHEFETKKHSINITCIFSADLVDSYASLLKNKIPSSNLFPHQNTYAQRLVALQDSNVLLSQGVLYLLCGEFHECAQYVDPPMKDSSLIEKIFRFVDENYRGDCTLKALSAQTTYNYDYLSRYFKQYTGMSFIEYVNTYRVTAACKALKNTSKTVISIAFESGFDSLRNFNRLFKKAVGKTPSEYRA